MWSPAPSNVRRTGTTAAFGSDQTAESAEADCGEADTSAPQVVTRRPLHTVTLPTALSRGTRLSLIRGAGGDDLLLFERTMPVFGLSLTSHSPVCPYLTLPTKAGAFDPSRLCEMHVFGGFVEYDHAVESRCR